MRNNIGQGIYFPRNSILLLWKLEPRFADCYNFFDEKSSFIILEKASTENKYDTITKYC